MYNVAWPSGAIALEPFADAIEKAEITAPSDFVHRAATSALREAAKPARELAADLRTRRS